MPSYWRIIRDYRNLPAPKGREVLADILNASPWRWAPDVETAGWVCIRHDGDTGSPRVLAIVASNVRGTRYAVNVDVPAMMECALALGATHLALIHNHPSGDSYPSGIDCDLTVSVSETLRAAGLNLVEHLVVGFNEVSGVVAKQTLVV